MSVLVSPGSGRFPSRDPRASRAVPPICSAHVCDQPAGRPPAKQDSSLVLWYRLPRMDETREMDAPFTSTPPPAEFLFHVIVGRVGLFQLCFDDFCRRNPLQGRVISLSFLWAISKGFDCLWTIVKHSHVRFSLIPYSFPLLILFTSRSICQASWNLYKSCWKFWWIISFGFNHPFHGIKYC